MVIKKALTGLNDTICTFGNTETLKALFGDDYKFYGIKRSREKPALEPFNPTTKCENVLASVNRAVSVR